MFKWRMGVIVNSKKAFALLVTLALAVGMCPMAYAASGDDASMALSTAVSETPKIAFSSCEIKCNERIHVGSKNMNPIKSVKDVNGKTLKKGTDYTVEYFKGDRYYDLTTKVEGIPTETGRYMILLKPVDVETYSGMCSAYYQVIDDTFVERVVTEDQEADITDYEIPGNTVYTIVYDSQTPWTHYSNSAERIAAWKSAGFYTYQGFSDKAVLRFLQDPNSGQYFIGYRSPGEMYKSYTQKGLTYNMPLCVAVTEASYQLNKCVDTVSDELGYDVSAKKTWVTSKAYDNLKAAIDYAESIGTQKGASSSKVKAATNKLNKALKAFSPAQGKKGKKLNMSKVTVKSVKSTYKFTGKTVKVTPVVKMGAKTFKAGKHYTVAFKNSKGKTISAKKVKAKGKYKVVIKAKKTSYLKGSRTVSFKIK